MEKLKVGDKVYSKEYKYNVLSNPTSYIQYDFAEVVIVSDNKAALSNGVILLNKPFGSNGDIKFCSLTDDSTFFISTPEIEAKAKEEKGIRDVYRWVKYKKY